MNPKLLVDVIQSRWTVTDLLLFVEHQEGHLFCNKVLLQQSPKALLSTPMGNVALPGLNTHPEI